MSAVICYFLLLLIPTACRDHSFTAVELSLLFNFQMLILLNLLSVIWSNVGTRQVFCRIFLKNKVPRWPVCFAVLQFFRPCILGNYPAYLVGLNVAPPF